MIKPRGYFGIGVYNPKVSDNIGTLWRHARLYGAGFIFTIGARYHRQPTDTSDSPRHIPLYNYTTYADFKSHVPKGCGIVCIEMGSLSRNLVTFAHPERAVYLLGAEDRGIPEIIVAENTTIQIPSTEPQSMNVSTSGTIVMYDRFTKQLA